MYTTEQYARLALQASNAMHHYEMEQQLSTNYLRQLQELKEQNNDLHDQIAVLQAKIIKLEQITRYE